MLARASDKWDVSSSSIAPMAGSRLGIGRIRLRSSSEWNLFGRIRQRIFIIIFFERIDVWRVSAG